MSNAGKKRGRGKGTGKKVAKDLNRGQIIGVGKKNVLWPGLNSPIIRGKEIMQQQMLPEDIEREQNILKIRDAIGGFRVIKLSPVDRGWSGSKIPGRSIGAPDSIGDENFDEFETRVLENKIVFIMKGNMGRKRRFSILSVTGNSKGLAGFAIAKASDARTALRKSKNRAGQKLIQIELCDNRTVFHDFHCAFGKTKIFVSKKPEGYGLVCHRAIKTICKVIGIDDIHAKIEGSTNLQHIVKAFFIGILKQKTHKQMADEKKLHLVEFRKEEDGLPHIVASPDVCRKEEIINKDEIVNYSQYVLGNKIVLKNISLPPFYTNTIGYKLFSKKNEYFRNQNKVRLNMFINYNELKSFLNVKTKSEM